MDVVWVLEITEERIMDDVDQGISAQRNNLLKPKQTKEALLKDCVLCDKMECYTGDVSIQEMFLYTLLRCVTKDEAKRILMEVYEGSCGDHTVGRHRDEGFTLQIFLAYNQPRCSRLHKAL